MDSIKEFKDMQVRTYMSKKDRNYYFAFIKDKRKLVKSLPYKHKEECLRGMRLAVHNALNQPIFKAKQFGKNRFYFSMVAQNGELIGSSIKFNNIPEIESVLSSFAGREIKVNFKSWEEEEKIAKEVKKKKQRIFEPFLSERFEEEINIEAYKNNSTNKFHFHFEDLDGMPVVVSKAYSSEEECKKGIALSMENAPYSNRYRSFLDPAQGNYFELTNKEDQTIERSVFFDSKEKEEEVKGWFYGVHAKAKAAKDAIQRQKEERIRLARERKEREETIRLKAEKERLDKEARLAERMRIQEEEEAKREEEIFRLREEKKKKKQERREELARLKEEEKQRSEERKRAEAAELKRIEEERLAEEQRLKEEKDRIKKEEKRIRDEQRKQQLSERTQVQAEQKVRKQEKKEVKAQKVAQQNVIKETNASVQKSGTSGVKIGIIVVFVLIVLALLYSLLR